MLSVSVGMLAWLVSPTRDPCELEQKGRLTSDVTLQGRVSDCEEKRRGWRIRVDNSGGARGEKAPSGLVLVWTGSAC